MQTITTMKELFEWLTPKFWESSERISVTLDIDEFYDAAVKAAISGEAFFTCSPKLVACLCDAFYRQTPSEVTPELLEFVLRVVDRGIDFPVTPVEIATLATSTLKFRQVYPRKIGGAYYLRSSKAHDRRQGARINIKVAKGLGRNFGDYV